MAKQYNWWEAHFAVWTLNIQNHLGHDDWRLPTIEELFSIVDYKINPACKFSDTVSSFYWSSTTYAYDTDNAWGVHFSCGYVYGYDKTDGYYVRAVRSGKDGLEWSETL